ncbi:hypothetical protein F2P79_000671 [Pimephales promelas]|nr:hypothetical protein F2P79_000671 [Pimephales promelas]
MGLNTWLWSGWLWVKVLVIAHVTTVSQSAVICADRNCRLVTGALRSLCKVETVTNGEDRMLSSQLVFCSLIESCTFMAFVSVSGDFCQAQHLVIVDK